MSLPSESIRPRRRSLAWAIAVIAIIAADLTALRPSLPLNLAPFHRPYPQAGLRETLPPHFPNLGLVVWVLVLEVRLFRAVSRRGGERTYWLGFEVAGWACVLAYMAFARAAWRLARSVFEEHVLGRQIGRQFEMGRFLLFAGGLSLVISLAIALVVGSLARSAWRRWGS